MKCMLCGSEENSIFAANQLDGFERNLPNPPKGLDVRQCTDCGLFFFDPTPTREELKDYHDKQYFVCHNPLKQTGYPNYIDAEHLRVKIEWGKRILSWFRQFDLHQQGQKRVLDVGCAVGAMLEGMKQTGGIEAVGVDISAWAIEWGKQRFPDIALSCGRLPEVELVGKFDYVLFWDSLEHDDNVHEVIKSAVALLNDGGLVLIQTPDGGMAKKDCRLPSCVTSGVDGINSKGLSKSANKDWYYWSPHQHTCIFNVANLKMLLEAYGLKVLKRRLSSEPDELILLARR